MGCKSSTTAALNLQNTRPESAIKEYNKPKFAIEEYKEKHPNLLESQRQSQIANKARRKPVLKVPEKVIAPADILTDVGCNAYRSMHSSPKLTFKETLARQRKDAMGHLPIDDLDEPPNHETYADYITHLDMFMWDLECHPERLSRRVAELRSRMDRREHG